MSSRNQGPDHGPDHEEPHGEPHGARPVAGRGAALLLGFGLAGLLAAAFWLWWDGRQAARQGFVELSEVVPDLEPAAASADSADALVRRRPLTREQYALLEPGPMSNSLLAWDPVTFYRYLPGIHQKRPWAEHPRGRWILHTNELGWRENEEFVAPGGDPCVLVTGDSHADGLCDNHESFTNLAEAALRRANPARDVKLWNTSKGGYTFYFYLGVLEKFLELEPELFVVCVYGGNDFVGQMSLFHAFEPEHGAPQRPRHYTQARRIALETEKNPMMQGFNALAYFTEFPEEAPLALRSACDATREMKRLCDAARVPLLVIYLPPLFDVASERYAALREVLGLGPEDLLWIERHGEQYLQFLADERIAVLDLRPELAGRSEYAWKQDQHLNLAGHELIAKRLTPLVAEMLGLAHE